MKKFSEAVLAKHKHMALKANPHHAHSQGLVYTPKGKEEVRPIDTADAGYGGESVSDAEGGEADAGKASKKAVSPMKMPTLVKPGLDKANEETERERIQKLRSMAWKNSRKGLGSDYHQALGGSEVYRKDMGGVKRAVMEDEQIDELKKSTLASYAKKATDDVSYHSFTAGTMSSKDPERLAQDKKAMKRQTGVIKAIDRLAKEEVEQVDEAEYVPTQRSNFIGKRHLKRDHSDELGSRYVFSTDPAKMKKSYSTEKGQKNAANRNVANLKATIKSSLGKHSKPNLPEEVEQVDEGSKRMSAAVKLQRAFDREKVSSDASRKRGEEMLAQARAEYAKKQAAKTNEEVEQIDEISPGLARKAAAASQVKAIEFSDYSGLSNLHNKEGKKEGRRLDRKSDKAMDYIKKRQGQKGVDKVNRMVTRVVGEEAEQVDEANMRFDPEAAARPKSSDVKNFLNRDKNARAGAASKKYIRRMTKLGGLGPNQTKKDTEKHMKDYFEEVEISEASKEGKSVMYGMRASMKAMDLRHGVDSDKRDSGYKMSPAVRAAQAKSDALSKVEKPVQAGTLAALKRRAMKKEEVESVDEGVISAVKNAQAKWKTAHRAVYGKDSSLKSMTVGAIARLAGAKASTARAVGAAVGGKPVSAQQQAAAKARAGKVGMAKMRNEEKHEGDDVNANVKGKKAAEKMTKKAAEVRKAKIQGSVNKINMEPTIDLNKKAEK